jgi:glycosyltransferase involved in cell wall biosynthesis
VTKQRKTFLLFVPWMVPGGADRCGVDLLRYYKLKGWRTIVCSTRENVVGNLWRNEFEKWADAVVDYGVLHKTGKSPEAIRSLILQAKPRVIVINNSHEAYQCVRMIRKLTPDCLLTCLVHMNIAGSWDFPGKAAEMIDAFDRVLCVSEDLAISVRGRIKGGERLKERVQVMRWFPFWPKGGMNDRGRDEVRKELGVREPTPLVVCPMRITEQKNPMAICQVARLMPHCEFLIAGDGLLRGEVEKQALPNVRILGYVAHGDMPVLLRGADAVFLPSRDEGIPLCFMEAMAMGVPVVATIVGGVGELVTDQTGWPLPKNAPIAEMVVAVEAALSMRSRAKVEAGKEMVFHGAFSFGRWQSTCDALLDDSQVQNAPLVRVEKSHPLTKVFVIGAPKTGTSSVGRAYEMMGCRDKGFDPMLQTYVDHGHFPPVWDTIAMYDSFSDGPFNSGVFYEKLYNRFPGAKFVLTMRDEESWLKSHMAHFSPNGSNSKVKERFRMLEYSPEEWREWFRLRNAAIRSFFASRDASRLLLEIDIFSESADECWKKLAAHVQGLSPPPVGTPFPHTNATLHI